MKKIKNKKIIFILVFIFSIGGTLAYFTSTIDINNVFQSGTYKSITTEEFISPNDWKPGDVTPKTIVTKNEGDFPVRVRIKLEQKWYDSAGSELPLVVDGELAAIVDLDNRDDWIYEDEYYYYKYDLMPGETTSSFIKSVTFNKKSVGDFVCETIDNIEQCHANGLNYQDADYHLNIETSTVQADAHLDAWDLEEEPTRVEPTGCVFNGELVQGAEYVNGQYTYKYMQEYGANRVDENDEYIYEWLDMDDVGWGVRVTDPDSTDPVTSDLCTYINNVPVVSYRHMFFDSKTTAIDTSSFETSNVVDMGWMFQDTTSVTSLDVSNFETSNVKNMEGMFYGQMSRTLDVSSFDTSNVVNMNNMFKNNRATKLDLSSFDTSNVTDMSAMFRESRATTIDFSSFNTSNVTNMRYMFGSCYLTGNQDFSHFDTSKVTNMGAMFYQSRIKSFDLSTWDTSKVTNMNGMFSNAAQVVSLDLSSFDTSNVTNMSCMFQSTSTLEEVIGIEDWDVSRVTTFSYIFNYASSIKRLDLKKWNTQSANVNDAFIQMFYYCTSLTYLDVSNFNTEVATSLSRTFGATHALTDLNLINWDVSNVLNLYYFVVNDKNLLELDLSSFDTSKVTNMSYLFHGCTALRKLYISDLWDMSSVTASSYMFYGNSNLTGDISNRYTMRDRISNLNLTDSSTRYINVGESITIPKVNATYTDNSTAQIDSDDLIWMSSDLDVAKANLGVITGVAPGNAVITIKSGIVEYTFNVVIVE